MPHHFQRALEKLNDEFLAVGDIVQRATQQAIESLVERRRDQALEVIAGDEEVDDREIQVEDECLKLLALYQPVAIDLRYLISIMKVNNDLERVGDLASNIAERAVFLAEHEPVPVPQEILEMGELVRVMLRDGLAAVVSRDTELARAVLRQDEAVDSRHRHLYTVFQDRMRESPATIRQEIQLLSVSRYLERIADLATNIAEDVVFMVDGEVIRHQGG